MEVCSSLNSTLEVSISSTIALFLNSVARAGEVKLDGAINKINSAAGRTVSSLAITESHCVAQSYIASSGLAAIPPGDSSLKDFRNVSLSCARLPA
jgi:hypothetical protein